MPDNAMFESVTLHLVRPEDLNHHGTLFAGQIARWLIEAGFITAARLVGKPEDVVCVEVDNLVFQKPLDNGDIIEIRTKVAHLGFTSITVRSEVFRKQDRAPVVSNLATFVTVDKQHKPYKHGLKLTDEYIAANRSIYEAAIKTLKVK
jgi:acyl-CoA hydrolase